MKKRKLKKNIKTIIATVLLSVFIILIAIYTINNAVTKPAETTNEKQSEVVVPVETPTEAFETKYPYYTTDKINDLRKELMMDIAVNIDVKACFDFQNGLINAPVLQGKDNSEYLYKDWKTGESSTWGSIALDSRNNLNADEMNTIIYGHYVYEARTSDRTLVFTPLSQLLEEENYENNKYLSLTLPSEIRYYEVAAVYDCPMEEVNGGQVAAEDLQFNLLDYDEDYFQTYLSAIKEHEYYDTGVEIQYGDKLLSLSTCIEDHPESREIVLCKEVGRESIE